MKVLTLLISVSTLIFLWLTYELYKRKKGTSHYTTPGGKWMLTWDAPTGGGQASSYNCVIDDTTNSNTPKNLVNTNISTTSITLDPTLFIPVAGSEMSKSTYQARITPVNSTGNGPVDTLNFNIYDTPTIISIFNADTNQYFYNPGGNASGDIFDHLSNPVTLAGNMVVLLRDVVTADKLILTVTYNGTVYTPTALTSKTGASEDNEWYVSWHRPIYFPDLSIKVDFLISANNVAGNNYWENKYTPPQQVPGEVTAKLQFQTGH